MYKNSDLDGEQYFSSIWWMSDATIKEAMHAVYALERTVPAQDNKRTETAPALQSTGRVSVEASISTPPCQACPAFVDRHSGCMR